MTKSKHLITNRKLKSEVNVCNPHNQQNVKKYMALWDTGAGESFITENVISDLELKITGDKVTYVDASGNENVSDRYNCYIQIVDHLKTYTLQIAKLSEAKDGCNVLIGMDIIEKLKLILDKGFFEIEIE